MRVGLSFDLRNPEQWRKPWNEFYGATIDLIVEAERLGIDAIKITEHHRFEDGYIPQPLTFLAAVASRTSKIRLTTGIMILPLHAVVEVAEQAAVVDCLSGGRVELGFGLGYHEPEYALYGADYGRRFKVFEEHVLAIRKLWKEGKITPSPVQPEIPLWAGLRGPKNSRMAGRLGMGLLNLPETNWKEYLAGLDEGGYGRKTARLAGTMAMMLAEDPEAALTTLAPRMVHNANSYAFYAAEGTHQTSKSSKESDFARATGMSPSDLAIYRPEQAAQRILEQANGREVDIVYLVGTISGVIDNLAYRNVELIAKQLKPLLNQTQSAKG